MPGDYVTTVLAAGWVSVQLAIAALILAIVLGLLGALCKLSDSRVLRLLAGTYTTLIRGVPDLVLMLLIFYSLPALLNQGLEALGSDMFVEFSPFVAGCVTLGLIFGAYMTETFRGSLLSVPHGQIEAARAYGLGRLHTLRRIVLPQMIRLALPGFTNNWLVLFKATALVSLLGLHDIMFRARGAAEATGKPLTFYLIAGAFYLAITIVSLLALRWVAHRYSLGHREIGR